MSGSRVQLDSEPDRIFHRREWRIERVGWAFVAIFLTLAIAGMFGGGPLSHARASGAAGSVEYERFVRSGTSTDIVVRPAGAASTGVNRVEISADFLEAFRIEHITPEPTAVRMTGQHLVYEFSAAGTPGASISFHVHPQRLGRHSAVVRIDGGAPLEISQLTYPGLERMDRSGTRSWSATARSRSFRGAEKRALRRERRRASGGSRNQPVAGATSAERAPPGRKSRTSMAGGISL